VTIRLALTEAQLM